MRKICSGKSTCEEMTLKKAQRAYASHMVELLWIITDSTSTHRGGKNLGVCLFAIKNTCPAALHFVIFGF